VPPEPTPLQPERMANTSRTPTMATRVRRRCSETSRNMIINMSMTGTTTLMEPSGKRGEAGGGATVATVTNCSVEVAVRPAAGVTDAGITLHEAFLGTTAQLSATAALNVPTEVTVTVALPGVPGVTGGIGVGVMAKVKPGATAATLPVSETVCGLVAAPFVSVSVAVSVVATEGV